MEEIGPIPEGRPRAGLPAGGGCGLLLIYARLGCRLPALHGLRAKFLGEPLDAALGIEELLTAREERVAIRADFQMQLVLGRMRLPGRAARAPRLDLVVLGVNLGLHCRLL